MKQIAVIGLGTFGHNLVKFLSKQKCEILAIDSDEYKVQGVAEEATQVIQADAGDEKFLKEIGIFNMDIVIICIGENIEGSILITMMLKNLGVKYIVAKAINELQAKVLRKVGADKIVFPERDMAERVANILLTTNILESINLSPEYELMEIKTPKKLIGVTLKDAKIRDRFGINVVALKSKVPYIRDDGKTDFNEIMTISPKPGYEIAEGDVLLIIGEKEEIKKLKEM